MDPPLVDVEGPSALVDFLAGTSAGIASLLAGHPFDTIKTRLQAQSPESLQRTHVPGSSRQPLLANIHHHNGGGSLAEPHVVHSSALSGHLHTNQQALAVPRYTSSLDALNRIIAEERFMGLYKGVTSPMLGVAVSNASIFGVYGVALRLLDAESFSNPNLANIFLAGCASGVVSALITSPIDLVKIRQQLSFEVTSKEPSTWSVTKKIWRRGGLRGLYRGLGSTCIRDLGYGPYFWSYEVFNRFLLSQKTSASPQLSSIDMAISGGLAGVLAWLSTFGADVVKTRVQATEHSHGRSAFVSAAQSLYQQGGWRAFLAGVGPTIVRALPVNAAMFVTFEATKDALIRAGL